LAHFYIAVVLRWFFVFLSINVLTNDDTYIDDDDFDDCQSIIKRYLTMPKQKRRKKKSLKKSLQAAS